TYSMEIKVNGTPQNYTYNASNNSFEAHLTLNEGANTIVLTATNSCGTDTKSASVNVNTCVQPSITLATPSANTASVEENSYIIKAKTNGTIISSDISVTVNDTPKTFDYNSSTNIITINTTNLNVGANVVVINISNACGNTSQSYTITYSEPAPPCTTPD